MAVAGEGVRLVVDLGDRSDTSSDLLFRLHRLAAQLRRLGGSLAVVSPQPSLRRLFDLTLLSQAFPVFATRDEALRNWR
jgi:anti-anti-sigma regulatory factor